MDLAVLAVLIQRIWWLKFSCNIAAKMHSKVGTIFSGSCYGGAPAQLRHIPKDRKKESGFQRKERKKMCLEMVPSPIKLPIPI